MYLNKNVLEDKYYSQLKSYNKLYSEIYILDREAKTNYLKCRVKLTILFVFSCIISVVLISIGLSLVFSVMPYSSDLIRVLSILLVPLAFLLANGIVDKYRKKILPKHLEYILLVYTEDFKLIIVDDKNETIEVLQLLIDYAYYYDMFAGTLTIYDSDGEFKLTLIRNICLKGSKVTDNIAHLYSKMDKILMNEYIINNTEKIKIIEYSYMKIENDMNWRKYNEKHYTQICKSRNKISRQ